MVHYGEIGTKGGNRQVFEATLRRNILAALGPLAGAKIRMVDNRLLVSLDDEGKAAEARALISKVFGVAWCAGVEGSPLSYPEILETAVRVLDARAGEGEKGKRKKTFRVSARRSNKSFGMTSQELARRLGEDIIARLGLAVDLSEPGVNLSVDVISDEALVYAERVRGPGGLPVGSSGRVLHLLSGGIDSPVAAWLMMKRGCALAFLHFYLAPGPGPIVASKISDLVRQLAPRGEEQRLILIPFSTYQVATTDLRQEFEPVVFRRFMRMVAERVAAALSMPAISTGDSLAQVASQTLQNIACIDSGASLPTLRPLLGYDKDEIVRLAKQVGTYETSLLEYKDCCSIVSRHPRTRMKIADVDEAARLLAFDELAERCVSMGTAVYFREDGAVDQRPLAELLGARSLGERGAVQPTASPPAA